MRLVRILLFLASLLAVGAAPASAAQPAPALHASDQPFRRGVNVLGYDPYPMPDWAKKCGVEYCDAKTLARESHVISLHTPLTPETHHIIRKETLELMKPGTILINVSRGALIDTKALIEALKCGRIGGVGLDVYEEEEGVFFEDLSGQILQDDELARLLTFPNVLITAHQAFLTQEALSEIGRVTVANLLAFARGQSFLPETTLNPQPETKNAAPTPAPQPQLQKA